MAGRYDFKEVENSVLDFWKKDSVYEKVKKKNEGNEKFYFLQGPPYTSGRIHIGHAWNNSMKDIILRYKRMKGLDVWDKAGYDMHGLPTENKVQKKFELQTKGDILNFGMEKFVKECRKFAEENAKLMDEDLFKLGVWMDYENAYWPVKNSFIEGEWLLIKEAHKQDRLYKGKKVMTWCGDCETALAKHELEYENVTDESIFLKFKIKGTEDEYLIIWTTTPWTIPFNLAVMVNPELDYVKTKVGDEKWIIAKDLAGPFIKGVANKDFEILNEFKGEELDGVKYIHPFSSRTPKYDEIDSERVHTVILSSEYVDTSAGSGLVHSAPGCGPEDYEVGKEHGLPAFNKLNEEGVFEDFDPFTNMSAVNDNKQFIEMLKEDGALIATSQVDHEYPHCWRCHKPVVFRATEQWFLKAEDLSGRMVEFNENVNWVPEESGKNLRLWVENLKDNSITRQRFWGCPVPVWECECGEREVIGSLKELKEKAVTSIPEDLHKPYIDEVKLKCPVCEKEMERIPDVLDVWIDSGTLSWNCLDYPQREDNLNRLFPADLVLEATEQTRLWFTMLQMASAIVFDKSSYKNAYTHGMILDYQGMKLSKSLGNIISPYEVMDSYGSDVLRYYMCQTAAGKNINFNWDDVKLKHRNLNILWNLHNYLMDLEKQVNHNVEPSPKSVEESYIISKLNSTIKSVTEHFEKYELDQTIGEMEDFILEVSRTYVQMVRDKASVGSDEDKKLIYETLKDCVYNIIRMFSTICPFITEKMYQNLKPTFGEDKESVHMLEWPEQEDNLIDNSLEDNMKLVQDIIQSTLSARERASINLRWPVKDIIVSSKDTHTLTVVENYKELIKQQTNVKEVKTGELEGVDYEVKLNFRSIGKKYGKLVPQISQIASELEGKKIYDDMEKEGKHVFEISGNEVTLTPDDVSFEIKPPENFSFSEFGKGVVFLDKQTNEELETEGFSRELMRRVQQLRKKDGLSKTDVIKLHIKTDYKNIELYSEHIADKCGAEDVTISEEDSQLSKKGDVDIKDKSFEIFFDKR